MTIILLGVESRQSGPSCALITFVQLSATKDCRLNEKAPKEKKRKYVLVLQLRAIVVIGKPKVDWRIPQSWTKMLRLLQLLSSCLEWKSSNKTQLMMKKEKRDDKSKKRVTSS